MKIHFQQSSILWIIAGLATIANVLMHILRGEEMVFQGNTEIVPLFGFAAGLALIGLAFRPANRKLPPNLLKSTTETWPFAIDSVFYAIKANMPAKNIDNFVFTCTLETEDPVNHRLVYDIEAVEDSDVLFEFKKISGRIAMDISLAVDPGNAAHTRVTYEFKTDANLKTWTVAGSTAVLRNNLHSVRNALKT